MRKAVSVTLSTENLLWLRGQAGRSARRSVSDVVDQLVTTARLTGQTTAGTIRSVVGSVELPDDDLELRGADDHLRALFAASASRPFLVREHRQPLKRSRRG